MAAITKQQLENASLDADDLGVVVNGGPTDTTVNRAGNTLPSVEKFYADMTETVLGVLGAKTYLTYDEMVADTTQPNRTPANVTNDPDPAKNGYYVWNEDGSSSVWLRSEVQPAQAGDLASLQTQLDTERSTREELPRRFEQPNLFTRRQLLGLDAPLAVIGGTWTPIVVDGITVHRLEAAAGQSVRVVWEHDRVPILGNRASSAFMIKDGQAGTGGNFARLTYFNASGTQIGTSSGDPVPATAVANYPIRQSNATIPAGTAKIRVDIQFVAAAGSARSVDIYGLMLCGGELTEFRMPDEITEVRGDIATTNTNVATNATRIETVQRGTPMYLGNVAKIPAAVRAALGVGGARLVQDFSGGLVTVFHPERNEAALSLSKTTYYFSSTGANGNDGLTRATPKKSLGTFLSTLVATTDIEIIIIGTPGQIFRREDSLAGVTWNQPYHLSIRAETEAIISSSEPPGSISWTADDNAYTATLSAVGRIHDASIRDYRGVPIPLKKVATVADVKAQAGTWCLIGTQLTIRTHDDRAPDASLIINRVTGVFFASLQANKHIYLENLKFCQFTNGGVGVTISSAPATMSYATIINCSFFGADDNGIGFNRIAFAYMRDCTTAYNRIDGTNFHNSSNPLLRAIALEFRDHSYDNGNLGDTGGTYNASTAHDGMIAIRISCVGFNCFGPVLADVNGCLSYNVDCAYYACSMPGTGVTRSSYWFDDDGVAEGTGEAYLIGCSGGDSVYDIHARLPSVRINVLGWRGGAPVVGPNAVITKYLQ